MIFAARSALLLIVLSASYLGAYPSYNSFLTQPGIAETSRATAVARGAVTPTVNQGGHAAAAAKGDKRRTLIQYLKQLFGSAN